MRSIKVSPLTIVLTLMLSGIVSVSSYAQELSKAELERRAEKYFENRQFDKSAADFKILQGLYPKEPRYAYYLGRSYLGANQELETAIDLLKYSATRNYGNDSYYYLGKAYHLTYQFENAIMSFRTFKKTAKSKDLKNYDIEYWLQISENAKASVLMAQKVKIEGTNAIRRDSPESGFTTNIDGKYIYVPDELKSKTDLNEDYQSLLFLSDNIEVGDYLYFDCLSLKSKQGTDIYRVQRLTAGDFSLPEPIGEINTKYDERYPYFDKATSTLYFSSNGLNSTGGLDIFSTQYDSVTGQWTSIQRLNFPINSVYDDFLYTPTAEGENAIFISDRNNTLSDYTAYTMQLGNKIKYELPLDHEDMVTLSLLEPNTEIRNTDNNTLAESGMNKESATNKPVSTQWENKEADFDLLIQEALILQAQSDSLEWMANDLKEKAQKEDDYQQKQALISSMTTLDQESTRLEILASKKFSEAERIQKSGHSAQVADNSVLNEGEQLENGITVYTYKSSETEKKNRKKKMADEGAEAARMANQQISDGFSIMQSSPYSDNNPIPIASIPGGLIYRIQLGSFSNIIPENTFGGLTPVSKEELSQNIKYYVGFFKSITEARQALNKIKKYGYPDAFIVSYYERKKISVQKAREIEFAER